MLTPKWLLIPSCGFNDRNVFEFEGAGDLIIEASPAFSGCWERLPRDGRWDGMFSLKVVKYTYARCCC